MPSRKFNAGQEIVIEDLNSITPAILRELYDRVLFEVIQRTEDAFFGDGFLVSYSNANSVNVKRGSGFISDSTQSSPQPNKRLLYLAADENVVISTPDSVNDRIDIVCVRAALANELSGSRKVKDAISSTVSTESVVLQQDWEAEILIVDGEPDVSPVAPAVPTGYIKIAELEVSAGTGIANSGAVTDSRDLMPIGGNVILDTTGLARITAGASTPLSTIVANIDALLKNGYFEYADFDDLGSDPAAPGASKQRIYFKSGVAYFRSNGGAITPLGSGGGGGGGGANWQPVAGAGAIEDYEFDEKVFLFEQGADQAQVLWVRVPNGYLAGRPITLKASFYSPASSNQFKMQAEATLIRKNNDAIDSTTNQEVVDSGDITNAVAKRMRELSFALSADGEINGIAVSPGDIVKIVLSRIAPGGTEDTEAIRFIPSSTEVLFT